MMAGQSLFNYYIETYEMNNIRIADKTVLDEEGNVIRLGDLYSEEGLGDVIVVSDSVCFEVTFSPLCTLSDKQRKFYVQAVAQCI